jgi:5-formyltetrahydrofolate cyclo-ligase
VGRAFASKEAARRYVWDVLAEQRVARFPFPPHGRIPNFAGAEDAAERLLAHPLFVRARRIKVNPDAPQRPVRRLALARGITVYVPTPRLRGGFRCFDPGKIPKSRLDEAASLSRGTRYGIDVPLARLPDLDLIVTGSVAVTRRGKRCGKGHGYGDLEYAIFRELGHPAVPVVTSVHPLQLVGDFPAERHDLPVQVIATPDAVIEVKRPPRAPDGIEWSKLADADLEAMPVLRELERLHRRSL